MPSEPKLKVRRSPSAAPRPEHVVVDERARLLQHFRDLEQDFQRCMKSCKSSLKDLEFWVDRSRTRSDIETFVGRKLAAEIAGDGETYRPFFEQLLQSRPLTNRKLAWLCGYNLIPQAADLVLRAITLKVLETPARLVRRLTFGDDTRPTGAERLRALWLDTVIPDLRSSISAFSRLRGNDSWLPAKQNAVACKLIADRLSGVVRHVEPSPATLMEADEPPLSKTQKTILITMLQLDATTADVSRTAEEIAIKSGMTGVNPEGYKKPIRHLGELKLVKSKRGRGGGSWLTSEGCRRATRLKAQHTN